MNFRFYSSKSIIFSVALILLIVVVLGYVFFRPFLYSIISPDARYVEVCDGNDNECHKKNLPYQNSALKIEARIDDLINRMTVAEKIGQMALIEKNSVSDLNDIAKYGLGAMMSGGGGKPENNKPKDWLSMVDNFQIYSRKTRLGIPLLYGIDANHGHSNVYGATIFPHSIGLGASKDADLVRKVAAATAEEAAATGINWIFSPNLDVASDIRWGRTYETFGSDSELAGNLGQAFIGGLQSPNHNNSMIAATAKHYVGNGSSQWGSSINKSFFMDQGNSEISEKELREIHLEPFRKAVDADVKTVMVGLGKWNGTKISFNKYLVADVLKRELGFQGFVFSDWYGVYEKEINKYEALVKAVNAGVDMIMLPYDYKYFSDSMHYALASGDISKARLDDAVKRILKVKFELGLFDKAETNSANLERFRSEEHRKLARMAVRKSLVLLKNNKTIVPISKSASKILVAGSAADNLGKQSGGWTIEWQGIDGNWIPGTTILKGIRDIVSSSTQVEYDLKGNFIVQKDMADIGIAVVGENPYAEGWGDNENPKLSEDDIEAINNLKRNSEKIIVIIVSGRPLDIKRYANDWDSIISAWLPGSEGQGVADVLFGDYAFTGISPVNWDL